jgi:hypothetical protein
VELHRPVPDALYPHHRRQLAAQPSPGWFAVRSCPIGNPAPAGFGVLLRFVAGTRAADYFSTGGLSCLTLLLATVFVSCGLVVVLTWVVC